MCIHQFLIDVIVEWVGDPDSDSAGRLGLWQICQKDELFDNCSRSWENVLSVPTFSFQVSLLTISLGNY